MTTRDMGETWQKHTTSEKDLIEPGSCMASLIDVDRETGKDAGNWLLFSNPDSTRGRHHITIKASPDRGLTWPKEHRLLLDEENSAGYSCMSMIDENTVGILYEGSQAHMTFQRIPLIDLVGRKTVRKEARALPGKEALKLPRVFGDHMVLQADAQIPVWGTTQAGARVMITFGDDKKTALADEKGKWVTHLDNRKASKTPLEMTIDSNGKRIQIKDILIGEVWICAGQSNMMWPLNQSTEGINELKNADNPSLRLLHLKGGALGNFGSYTSQQLSRLTPEKFCKGKWEVASAESAGTFSAVGWYFGKRLQQKLDVPVGLICPAVGGTPTEAWIPRKALEADPELKGLVAGNWLANERLGKFCRKRGLQNLIGPIQSGETIPGDDMGPNHSFKPGFMWSAGIAPIIPYGIRGVIWYQGESNAETRSRVREHGHMFPLLIRQWRQQWGQDEFPFLYVQLPALNRPEWPWFRNGQRRTLGHLENLGMAITIDTGHPSNVHPRKKKPVGERLAQWAMGTTYGLKKYATYSGPLLKVAKRKGDSLVISFNQVGVGLKTTDKKAPRHFEICGTNGIFHPATARITSKNTLSVSSPRVLEPKHARYACLPYPEPPVNLFNSEDLPASPFSTEP
jgi:sialate O-acetylesterase